MGLGNLKSTTIIGDNVIDAVDMNTELYKAAEEQQHQEKAEPKTMPTMRYQKAKRVKPPKGNPVVPERSSYKNAAEKVHEANAKFARENNLNTTIENDNETSKEDSN